MEKQWIAFGICSDFVKYRELILSFFWREVNAMYRGTALGLFWSLIHPVLLFATYVVVFGFFLKIRTHADSSALDFILYFSAGFFPWIFFSNAVVRSTSKIIERRDFIKKLVFPSEILPLTTVFSEGVSFLISLSIVILFSFFVRGFSLSLFFLPVVVIVHFVFTLAFALFFSALTVYVRDLAHMVFLIFTVWFWATPVLYTIDMIPPSMQWIPAFNPVHYVLEFYRVLLFTGTMVDGFRFISFMIFSFILFWLSLVFFRKVKIHFSEFL